MSRGSLRTFSKIAVLVAFLWTGAKGAQSPAIIPPDLRQTEIAKLLDKAVSSKDPEEQIELYREILQIDPNNLNAFAGLKDAQQKAEQKKAEQEQKRAQAEQAGSKKKQDDLARKTAASDVDQAVAAGDLPRARTSLETLRKYGATSPEASRAEGLVKGLSDYRLRVMLTVAAVAVAILGIAFVFAVSFVRKKSPYLEVVEGPEQGQRFPLAREVTLIGSVSEYDDGKNDIVLSDEHRLISRGHCEIHKRDGRLYLLDCGSANGTFLNQHRLAPGTPVALPPGSRIDLAGVCALRLGFEKKKG